jgi:hypothetical protein
MANTSTPVHVNFVLLVLHSIQSLLRANSVTSVSTKTKMKPHPLCARGVELASTLLMPPLIARTVRRASIKRTKKQQHTRASFVSKEQRRLLQIQPRQFAQVAWEGSIRIKTMLHLLCARRVELGSTL